MRWLGLDYWWQLAALVGIACIFAWLIVSLIPGQ